MSNILLTGASSGIGQAAAELLTQAGHQVWGTSRSAAKLAEKPNFHPVEMDLSSTPSIQAAFATAEKEAGHFDVLINNAGEGLLGPLEAFTPEKLRAQLEVLLVGPHELIRLTLPSMRQRNEGTIINISSLAARFPVPFLGPYSAAKAALANYSETLRLELGGSKIRVIDLQPGDFSTGFAAATQKLAPISGGFYALPMESATEVMNAHMAEGPQPHVAARALLRIIGSAQRGSPVTVGSFYQAILSPILARFLPKSIMEQGLRDYYRLP